MDRTPLLAIAAFLVLVTSAGAQVPQTLHYQGVLTDINGTAVGDGDYNVSFRIYNVPSGGTALWSENVLVPVSKGIMSVVLGQINPIDLLFDGKYWLGIAVEGGAELTPRTALASVPSAFNAAGVYGGDNQFPGSGYAGIGTRSPAYPFTVQGDAGPQVAINAGTANSAYSSIYVQAYNGSARPGFGYVRGALRAHHYVDTDGSWRLAVDGAARLSVTPSGNVGAGVPGPLERLEVAGGIKLGEAVNEQAGTIQWTGSDFEGYDGDTWKSLTAAGGGSLPAGSLGSTLRHNGATWEAVQSLYNGGTNIGIGTTSPSAHLDVMGGGTQKIKVETTSATGVAVLGLESTAGVNDNFNIAKYGPSAAGTIAGIPATNLSLAASGIDAGAMLVGTQGASPLYFMANGNRYMRLDESGGLDLYLNSAAAASSARLRPTSSGGAFELNDENGNELVSLSPDDPDGGLLRIRRNATNIGFEVDGNKAGSGNPCVSVTGQAWSAIFDMSVTGNASVVVPPSSIDPTEMSGEPGVASLVQWGETVYLDTSPTVIASRSITAPRDGYALVIGTMFVQINKSDGEYAMAYFGVSNVSTTLPVNAPWLGMPGGAGGGAYYFPVTVHGVFLVSAGTRTFYLLGQQATAEYSAHHVQLTIMYVPTAYGEVSSMFASNAAATGGGDAPRVVTAADIERERNECVRLNEARMQREIDEVRAEVDRLRAEIRNGNQQ